MAIFEDPLRALRIELPTGWTYDPFTSSLTELYFGPWNRQQESLKVSIEPTRAAPNQSDEIWLALVKDEVTITQDFLDLPSRCGRAVAAEFQLPAGAMQRVALVRGPRVDFVFEHMGIEPTNPDPWATLRTTVLSVDSAVNHRLQGFFGPDKIRAAAESGLAAAKIGDTRSVLKGYSEAISMCTDDWLHTLTAFDEAPQVFVVLQIVPLLAEFSTFTNQPVLILRDAEQMARRAAETAKAIKYPRAAEAAQVLTALLNHLEVRMRKIVAPAEVNPWRRLSALVHRAEWLVKNTIAANESGDLRAARFLVDAAIADMLTVAVQRRRAAEGTPPDPTIWARGEQLWAVELSQVLHIKFGYTMDRQDANAAEDASRLLITTAELLADALPADSRVFVLEAAALMEQAGQLLDFGQEALEEADQMLLRAETFLKQSGDQSAMTEEQKTLRVQLCLNQGWVLFYLKKLQESMKQVEDGLAGAQNAPLKLKCSLHALKATLLLSSGRAVDAIAEADAAIGPADSPLSTHILVRALARAGVGQADGALTDIRLAVQVACADNVLGQDVVQILFAASELVEKSSQTVSLHLAWTAQTVMDARRFALQTESKRISFSDDARQRKVSEFLVSRLVDANDLGAALAASDQARARSLNQLLSPPDRTPGFASSEPVTLAIDVSNDVVTDLDHAATAVRRLAGQSLLAAGFKSVLSTDEILNLITSNGSTALALQPVGERIHLFLVRPYSDIRLVVAESPIATSAVSSALEQLQTELGIRTQARGEYGPPLSDDDDDKAALNEAIRIVSDALIAPVAAGLESGSPLIVVPYRELALVPFPLLTLPDGTQMAQAHAVSVVPSFATLALLRHQSQSSLGALYFVAGDPVTDPRYHLIPLEGAVEEATQVRDSLVGAGISASQISFRVKEQATETEYRRSGRGARLVHLACHAALRDPASQSALFLAADAVNDGQLYPAEISMIHLDDAIVFLSACQTGLGHPTADGVLGLSRSFLEAGARAVIMSLWKVADESTAVLAKYFYQRFLARDETSLDAAHALQSAMLATKRELGEGTIVTRLSEALDDHPSNWAPFLLLGDGGVTFHGQTTEH